MEANSDFPKFKDGDVVVVVSSTYIYQLHSAVLRRNSPPFAKLLREDAGAHLTAKARKEGVTVRYCIALSKNHSGGTGKFERKQVQTDGRFFTIDQLIPENQNARVADVQYQFWDWLFGSFYNRAPVFDDETLATVVSGCMGLIDVAESIDAVDNVREFVDLALLRQGTVLWNSVASNPSAWAELGRRVHSPTIYREGIVHLVGKWSNISDANKVELHEDIRTLCERKNKDLAVAKEAIEMRILGHYPLFLCRNAVDRPSRASYANDIYMWMAIDFFRQWFCQAISDGRTRVSPDGGYQFYRQLGEGGDAYLNHEQFRNFHQYFPMSSKACGVLEANMAVLKEEIKPFVKDILINQANVNSSNFELKWLTCALVQKEDYPWTMEESQTSRQAV